MSTLTPFSMFHSIRRSLKVLPYLGLTAALVLSAGLSFLSTSQVPQALAAAPTFTLAVQQLTGGSNTQIKVIFSEPVSGTSGGSTALDAADFTVAGTDGLTISSVDHIVSTGIAILNMSGALTIGGAGELTIACASTAIYDDGATNACTQGATDVNGAAIDTTAPTLSAWSLDMDAGTVTLNFSEPMDFGANPDETTITIQDDAGGTNAYTLTDSTGAFNVPGTFVITLSTTDLNALKLNTNIATSGTDAYIEIGTGHGFQDAVENALVDITTGVIVNSYTADTTEPTVASAAIDYNDNVATLTVTFSEPVDASALDQTKYHLNDTTGTDDVTLSQPTASGDGVTIVFPLTEAERSAAQALSGVAGGNGGAVVLDVDIGGITDMAANSNTADDDNTTVTETADTNAPTVTDGNITAAITTDNNVGGVAGLTDVITVTWDNSGGGDNNPDIASVSADLSAFGGGASVAMVDDGTAGDGGSGDGVWGVQLTISAGSVDGTNLNATVTATDEAGNSTGPVSDTSNLSVDNQAPTVTDGNISISGGSGTGGAYIVGDTVIARWDSAEESDTLNATTADLSGWGGGVAVAMTDTGCGGAADTVLEACFTLISGAIDATGVNTSITVTDDAGNSTTTGDTTGATVDNQPPTVTDNAFASTISTDNNSNSIANPGDVIRTIWFNSINGNGDEATVLADLSPFGGSSSQVLFDDNSNGDLVAGDDDYTYDLTIGAGTIDGTNLNATVTVTDDAGNTTGPISDTGSNLSVDNQAPTVTDGNISISGGSGTGGAYIIGDTVIAQWDSSEEGDTLASTTADLSGWGGGTTVAMTDTGCGGAADTVLEACFTLVGGAIDGTGINTSVTVTDDGGNITTTGDTTGATVDNIAPAFATSGLTISTDNGVGGVAAVNTGVDNDGVTVNATVGSADGDTITWDATPLGAGSATQANNTEVGVAAGATDTAAQSFNITATDDAGNSVTSDSNTIDGTTISIDNVIPVVTTGNISVAGATGTAGAFKNGDTPVSTWNNTAGGDNNPDIASVLFDSSAFRAGDTALVGSNSSQTWTANLSGAMDSQDDTNNNTVVTAVDDGGNVTTTAGTNNYTVDTIVPTLNQLDVDMDAQTETLTFSETVIAATLDVTAITNQDAATATTSYTLTTSSTASGNGTSIVIDFSAADFNAIVLDTGLKTGLANAFIRLTSAAIQDDAGNGVTAITDGSALQAVSFNADVTAPTLATWDLDLNTGTLTLNFSEAVDIVGTPLDVTTLTIQDAATAGTSYTLTTSSTASTNGATAVITLSAADLNAINSDGGLATSIANAFLTHTAALVNDLAGNAITAIADGAGQQANTYTADTTSPSLTSWSLDLSSPATLTLNWDEVVDASTLDATQITIQDAATATVSFTLTGGSTTSPDGQTIIVDITTGDRTSILGTAGMATSTADTFITFTNTLLDDPATNDNNAIADGSGVAAAGVTGVGGGGRRRTITTFEQSDVCGDGVVTGAEQCDDGNNFDNDGCSAICLVETPTTTTVSTGGGGGGTVTRTPFPETLEPTTTTGETMTTETTMTEETPELLKASSRVEQQALLSTVNQELGIQLRSLRVREQIVTPGTLSSANGIVTVEIPHHNVVRQDIDRIPAPTITRTENTINISFGDVIELLRPVLVNIQVDAMGLEYLDVRDMNGERISSIDYKEGMLSFRTNVLRAFVVRILERPRRATGFEDTLDSPEEEAIKMLRLLEIFSGYPDGTFGPNDILIRAQTSKVVSKAAGVEPDTPRNTDQWFDAQKRALDSAQITKGHIDPTSPEVRANFLALIAKAKGININTLPPCEMQIFSDVPTDTWYCPLVEYAAVMGWIKNVSGLFRPNEAVTRETAAGWVYRAFH